MITKAQKARLGCFLTVAVLVLLTLVGVLVGKRFIEKVDYYNVRFESSVSGLEVGAPVKYNGVKVGRVNKITIDAGNVAVVMVELALQEGTPIKSDTRAVAASMGITGLRYIELTRGTEDSKLIEPGGTIEGGMSTFDTLSDRAESITANVEVLIANVTRFTSAENLQRFQEILDNLVKISGHIEQILAENKPLIAQLLQNANALTESSQQLLTNTDNEVKNLFVNLNGLVGKVGKTVDKVSQTIDKVSRIVDKANMPQVTTSMVTLLTHLDETVTDPRIFQMIENTNVLITKSTSLINEIQVTIMNSKENVLAMLGYLLESSQNLVDFSTMLKENPAVLISGPSLEERELE